MATRKPEAAAPIDEPAPVGSADELPAVLADPPKPTRALSVEERLARIERYLAAQNSGFTP